MKKCLVIGGGLAGLSAAVHLTSKSYKVTILEASPKLGGRTYSLHNDQHKQFVDNGQHLMMGCYDYTLEFLKLIDALGEIEIQEKLRVKVVGKEGDIHYLASNSNLYPFNLLKAILNYSAVSFSERTSILKFFVSRVFYSRPGLEKLTVLEWLKINGQSERSINSFWEMIAIGTLNSSMEKSSALLFREVLKKVFFNGNNSIRFILPKNSLSQTFSQKAEQFILSNGGEIYLSERASDVTIKQGLITEIRTNKKSYDDFDFIVSAVPVNAFTKLIFHPFRPSFELPEMKYSPIISVHLWLKKNDFKERFYGLLDSKINWLFNNGTHITLVTSAADELVKMPNKEIIRHFCLDIINYFPYFKVIDIVDSLVIKEKSATFIPSNESNIARRKIFNPVKNLFLSGDWIDTGLPATIEGAIKSGKMAADWIVKY